MPLGVWEAAWDLARYETAFQDSGELTESEPKPSGRETMLLEKSRLPWACELDKGSGWVEICLPANWGGPGQGRGQQSKDLLPVPTCVPQLWALCYC